MNANKRKSAIIPVSFPSIQNPPFVVDASRSPSHLAVAKSQEPKVQRRIARWYLL